MDEEDDVAEEGVLISDCLQSVSSELYESDCWSESQSITEESSLLCECVKSKLKKWEFLKCEWFTSLLSSYFSPICFAVSLPFPRQFSSSLHPNLRMNPGRMQAQLPSGTPEMH